MALRSGQSNIWISPVAKQRTKGGERRKGNKHNKEREIFRPAHPMGIFEVRRDCRPRTNREDSRLFQMVGCFALGFGRLKALEKREKILHPASHGKRGRGASGNVLVAGNRGQLSAGRPRPPLPLLICTAGHIASYRNVACYPP